jgi:hypothetical protein
MTLLGIAFFWGIGWEFLYLQDLVSVNVFQRLANPARPTDFDGLGRSLGSQAEMHAFVARG